MQFNTLNGKKLVDGKYKFTKPTLVFLETNEVIAETLDVSLGLLHKLKKILYASLRIQTKQEGTLLAKFFNLI